MRKPQARDSPFGQAPTVAQLEAAYHAGWIVERRAQLRAEDRIEAHELAGFLQWIANVLPRRGARHLVDVAAGRGLVGVLAAHFFLDAADRLTLVDRDAMVLTRAREAAARLAPDVALEVRHEDLAEAAPPSGEVTLITALHACGDASDRAISMAVRAAAKHVLVAPCCVARDLPASRRAIAAADRMGLPDHAEVRRRHLEAWVLAERTLVLEASGYETVVQTFTSPRWTGHPLVLRARRMNEPVRAARAAERLARMRAAS